MTDTKGDDPPSTREDRLGLIARLLAEGLWRLHHAASLSASAKSEKTTPSMEKELESGDDPRLSGDVAVDGDERPEENLK